MTELNFLKSATAGDIIDSSKPSVMSKPVRLNTRRFLRAGLFEQSCF
jgi:hypothetical protein